MHWLGNFKHTFPTPFRVLSKNFFLRLLTEPNSKGFYYRELHSCISRMLVCSSAPCKVLNGGSRDEVITVWAVAGHHYDLITHNITTKYNYNTFIL